MIDLLSSPYFYTLLLVLLLTLVLRILGGPPLNGRFFLGLALQGSLALGWLSFAGPSSGPGALTVACLSGIVVLSQGEPSRPFTVLATALYGSVLWWSERTASDIPLYLDWFNGLVTVSGALVLRAYLDDAAENRWTTLGTLLGMTLTVVAVVAAWVPARSTAAVPLLLTAFIGLGAQLVKTARKRGSL